MEFLTEKATQGHRGVRVSRIKLSHSKSSRLDAKDVEDRIKNIIPSFSYDFFKIVTYL